MKLVNLRTEALLWWSKQTLSKASFSNEIDTGDGYVYNKSYLTNIYINWMKNAKYSKSPEDLTEAEIEFIYIAVIQKQL